MRIRLGGYVTNSEYARLYRRYGWTEVCCPDDIRDALAKVSEGEELIFEINSSGGSVYAGFEMYTLLRNAGRDVIGEIGSIAGSAASVFAMGCTILRISPVANMMIHRSATYASGNSEDMEQAQQMLDTIDESILNAYCQRAGDKCSKEKLQEMMENETFLTADQAVEYGLADEKMFQNDAMAMANAAVAMANGLRSVMANLPPIDELKRLSGEENKNTGTPERKEKNSMDLNELEREHPELVKAIREQAATAERQRLDGIEAMALPGFEELINEAKKDPTATAATVAVAIVDRQKKQGENFLINRQKDVEDSGAADVEGSAHSGGDADDKWDRAMAEAFPET